MLFLEEPMPSSSSVELSVEKLGANISSVIASNFDALLDLTGWIVVIDRELYLLEHMYLEEYENSKMIKISDKYIMFCIREKILPLGGGKSFLFHKARIIGSLSVSNRQAIEILPQELFVEERGGGFIKIDIDPESVKRSRERYEKTFVHPPEGWSGDWLDLVASPTTSSSDRD
jgi:hypothetical protein